MEGPPMPNIVLPYEPQYTGHRELEKRREATKEWLRQREIELAVDSPPLAPDQPAHDGVSRIRAR